MYEFPEINLTHAELLEIKQIYQNGNSKFICDTISEACVKEKITPSVWEYYSNTLRESINDCFDLSAFLEITEDELIEMDKAGEINLRFEWLNQEIKRKENNNDI